jgi:3-keto-disaccharide hydrolase
MSGGRPFAKPDLGPRTTTQTATQEEIMNRWSAIALGLFLTGTTVLGYSQQASSQGAASAWEVLFDGSHANNFDLIGNANWRIVNRILTADVGNGFLVSKKDYGDFQARAEFWVDDTANSGIFIRASDPKRVTAMNAYEVNIFDTRPDPSYGTGAIVNVAKVNPMPRAANQWNLYDITAKGDTFTIILNGMKTVDGAKDAQHPKGRIALQYGAGTVKFRRVEVRPL